ncbi:MAG TPA: HEAT repeat domain-containing protein, partial [Terriglobales bacterium]
MKLITLFIYFIILILSHALIAAQKLPINDFAPQASAEKAKPGEEEAYGKAQQQLNDGDLATAAQSFDQVAKMGGRRADAALYWKAYSQAKLGQRPEALSTITALRKGYPQSRYLKEAAALEIDVKKSMGQAPNPDAVSDDEIKLIAIDSLMNSDDERAIPILEKFLSGNSSMKLKDRALFVLSQKSSPKAQDLLGKIAVGQDYPDLQTRAIHYLGIEGGRANQTLASVYSNSKDPEIKKSVLHALMVSGDKNRVFAIARQEPSTDLKLEAIHQLGVMGAHEELHQLYKESNNREIKQELLHSMAIGGDIQSLIDVAKTETDPEVRKSAIHGLGISGSRQSAAALTSMYQSNADKGTKMEVIHALFIQGDAHDLVT